MKVIFFVVSFLLVGCGSVNSPGPCTGNSGATYSCSQGTSCSKAGGTGCSASVDGVSCCNGNGGSGGTNGGDGTNNCALGFCWTNPENVCCPENAQYACKGYCYTSNVCNYTSYQSACHQY